MQTALPEAMTISDQENEHISNIQFDIQPSAIGIGMGIGTKQETVSTLENLFKTAKMPRECNEV